MADTQSRNLPGNYALEKWAKQKRFDMNVYIHQSQGQANQTQLPGNGLLSGRYAGRDLAKNDTDIESFLFGIGSGNLETPQPVVKPDIRALDTLHVIQKQSTPVPKPFAIEENQRPLYLN